MASNKTKKNNQQQATFSPERLVMEKGRTVPMYKCYAMLEGLKNSGIGSVVVVRKFKSGKYAVGLYLVDTYCCGVKTSSFHIPVEEDFLDGLLGEWSDRLQEVSYEEAHNWIYGSIAWAEEAGIKPHKSFAVTQYLLEEDTDDIPLIEYEFGKNGKHFLVCHTKLEASEYLSIMEKNLKKGEYDYLVAMSPVGGR
ncbi:MAG: hypothetical protein MJZ33_08950 [Paludibacteraceae bacterium]|nr:hypothetical protein [Paludibacteraceae bacterium]